MSKKEKSEKFQELKKASAFIEKLKAKKVPCRLNVVILKKHKHRPYDMEWTVTYEEKKHREK